MMLCAAWCVQITSRNPKGFRQVDRIGVLYDVLAQTEHLRSFPVADPEVHQVGREGGRGAKGRRGEGDCCGEEISIGGSPRGAIAFKGEVPPS
jgi:hypothetical protein